MGPRFISPESSTAAPRIPMATPSGSTGATGMSFRPVNWPIVLRSSIGVSSSKLGGLTETTSPGTTRCSTRRSRWGCPSWASTTIYQPSERQRAKRFSCDSFYDSLFSFSNFVSRAVKISIRTATCGSSTSSDEPRTSVSAGWFSAPRPVDFRRRNAESDDAMNAWSHKTRWTMTPATPHYWRTHEPAG